MNEETKIYILYARGRNYPEIMNAYTTAEKAQEAIKDIIKGLDGINASQNFQLFILERKLL